MNMGMNKSVKKFRSYILIQLEFWENRPYEVLTRTTIKSTVFWAIEQTMKVITGIALSIF